MAASETMHTLLGELAVVVARLRAITVELRTRGRGGGAGVLWRADGLVVTSAHVVAGAHRALDDTQVVLADRRRLPGALVGWDWQLDLALLKVAAADLPAATVGDSDHVRPGELVLAVGSPFGLAGAVATGVVHAAPREGGRARFIQADLRLAPGNSGGPMADACGRVIGINDDRGRAGAGRAEPPRPGLRDPLCQIMIGVAVLASRPMARARLEALVAARPDLRLDSLPGTRDHAIAASADADVLLVDPGGRPAETVLRALSQAPRLPPVVLLADELAPAAFVRLLRAGVRAILPRDASAPEIAAGIEAVAAGLVVLHPSAPIAGARTPRARGAGHDAGTDPLTPRELEILTMMAEGMGNRAIARGLGISTHTVKFHIAAILDKLHARSRTEAVTTGMRRGLLMV